MSCEHDKNDSLLLDTLKKWPVSVKFTMQPIHGQAPESEEERFFGIWGGIQRVALSRGES